MLSDSWYVATVFWFVMLLTSDLLCYWRAVWFWDGAWTGLGYAFCPLVWDDTDFLVSNLWDAAQYWLEYYAGALSFNMLTGCYGGLLLSWWSSCWLVQFVKTYSDVVAWFLALFSDGLKQELCWSVALPPVLLPTVDSYEHVVVCSSFSVSGCFIGETTVWNVAVSRCWDANASSLFLMPMFKDEHLIPAYSAYWVDIVYVSRSCWIWRPVATSCSG